MFTAWKKYFITPAAYAPNYTRWSRNFLNLGIVSLMVSWFFLAGPMNAHFAFLVSISEEQVRDMPRVDGEWLYLGGRNPKAGIVVPGTKQFIAQVDYFLPIRTGPRHQRQVAIGYKLNGVGVIHLVVGGETVLTVSDAQEFYRREAYTFFGLVIYAISMMMLAVVRQIRLFQLNKKGQNQ